ncbi:MAG: competence/damage-inducible protein A, partial [Candidatus Brocadiaceae bacterium]
MPVTVTIISTGEELVLGRTADGNAPFLAAELGRRGFVVRRIVVVGDNPEVLRDEISRSLTDCRLVLVSGGLGPTADDRTRSAIAEAVGRELAEDLDARRHVIDRLHSFGREATPAQLSQALLPAGARAFPNPRGTARGFACEVDGAWVVAMPGVPDEMHAMFRDEVLPFLMDRLGPEGGVRLETVH